MDKQACPRRSPRGVTALAGLQGDSAGVVDAQCGMTSRNCRAQSDKTMKCLAGYACLQGKENEMNKKRTPFHKLPITNRFMFAMVFSHKEIAKPFLEAILGIKIFDLQGPEPEKSLEDSPFYKGVRYDVFVKEKGPNGESIRTFDLEMQVEDTKEIPKRARYYQAMSDSEELNKGEFYFNLKEQYVIFILTSHLFTPKSYFLARNH